VRLFSELDWRSAEGHPGPCLASRAASATSSMGICWRSGETPCSADRARRIEAVPARAFQLVAPNDHAGSLSNGGFHLTARLGLPGFEGLLADPNCSIPSMAAARLRRARRRDPESSGGSVRQEEISGPAEAG